MKLNMHKTNGLEINLVPRFSSAVLKMTEKELRSCLADVSRYLKNISPVVSIYASKIRERDMYQARLTQLNHG